MTQQTAPQQVARMKRSEIRGCCVAYEKPGLRCAPSGLRLLVAKDGLHPGLQGFHQGSTPLGIVEIADISKMPEVKRNVVLALGDQNHLPPKRVGDACFIE